MARIGKGSKESSTPLVSKVVMFLFCSVLIKEPFPSIKTYPEKWGVKQRPLSVSGPERGGGGGCSPPAAVPYLPLSVRALS